MSKDAVVLRRRCFTLPLEAPLPRYRSVPVWPVLRCDHAQGGSVRESRPAPEGDQEISGDLGLQQQAAHVPQRHIADVDGDRWAVRGSCADRWVRQGCRSLLLKPPSHSAPLPQSPTRNRWRLVFVADFRALLSRSLLVRVQWRSRELFWRG